MKSRKAFTLIELLVVVAIIVVLIALILPAISKAKEQAKRTLCLSHMKGIGTAFYTYAGNNKDMVPDGGSLFFTWTAGQVLGGNNGNIEGWPEELTVDGDVNVKYHVDGAGNAVQDGFAQGMGIFWCPSSLVEDYTEGSPPVHKTGKPDGTPESGQSGYGMGYYAGSVWYYNAGGPVAPTNSWTPPMPDPSTGKLPNTMYTRYWNPNHIVLVEGDTGFNGAIGAGGADSLGRYGVYTSRHKTGSNYLLGDGHAEFNATWNQSDTPGVPTPPAKTWVRYPESNWSPFGTTQMPREASVWGHNPNGRVGSSR